MKQKPLLIAVLFAVLICVSFVFLFMYFQSHRQLAAEEMPIQKAISQEIPLPEVSFIDATAINYPKMKSEKAKWF